MLSFAKIVGNDIKTPSTPLSSQTVIMLKCLKTVRIYDFKQIRFLIFLHQQVRSANELADFMRYDLEDDDSADLIDEVSADDGTITPEKKQKLKYYLKPIEKVGDSLLC